MASKASGSTFLLEWQKIVLLFSVLILTAFLFLARGGMNAKSPFEQLARQSLEPNIAISNGHPTLIEFYADWCEVCKLMAPTILGINQKFANDVDVVLLNVDNNLWKDFLTKYEVNGIPQINLFDKKGNLVTRSLGFRDEQQLDKMIQALLDERSIPSFPLSTEVSKFPSNDSLTRVKITNSLPRSHS